MQSLWKTDTPSNGLQLETAIVLNYDLLNQKCQKLCYVL